MRPVEDRFWSKVEKTDTCWLWLGARTRGGYGLFRLKKMRSAHRVVYEMMVGRIPDGYDLDHLCRVRHCVNPAHLEPVTERENALRGFGACGIHARKTACPHCGGSYSYDSRGGRVCLSCSRENRTLWARNHYAENREKINQRRRERRRLAKYVTEVEA